MGVRIHRSGSGWSRRGISLATLSVLTVAGAGFGLALAAPATAAGTVSPVVQRSASAVTADALPTVQIDGVVWSQAIVGNTVYAGGSFANARPPGAPSGSNLTPRGNLLAYNLTTGALITSFAPNLNAQVRSVVASPDGTRIYVGGSFTTADGRNSYRLAAYSTATNKLISSFQPELNATVNSISVTNTTVYAGGVFGIANGQTRPHLAAFRASDGALLNWAPNADYVVNAVQLTPDGSRVIVAGGFQKLNNTTALGMGAVSATTGATLPWAINQVVTDYGTDGAILSLSSDGKAIYGTGYTYGGPSNFEGTFSANPTTGAINWLGDCHGDNYGAYSDGTQVYVVSHQHYCANIGGFPDQRAYNPGWYRSTSFTANATGTVQTNGQIGSGYGNFGGQPSPSLVNWFPNLDAGTATGDDQGPWTVTGNGKYVIEGGEFLHVNGAGQQGLVRFAVPSIAPNKVGPPDNGAAMTPTVTVTSNRTSTITWPTDWDQDDQVLTYSVWRDDNLSRPVYTTTATSQFWNMPTLTYNDTGLTPGKTYIYWVRITDPNGNTTRTANVTVTTPNNGPVASQTSSCTNLTCAFDASGSTDVGGQLSSYSWDFGDGSTGTGVKPSHTYGQAGTYHVTLTVTDTQQMTDTATKDVTVTAAPPVGTYASDAFGRTVSSGWGTADAGGAWQVSDPSQFAVGSGVGTMIMGAAGAAPEAFLPGVSATDVVQTVDVSGSAAATGNGYFLSMHARAVGDSNYQLKVRVLTGGAVHLVLSKVVGGNETIFSEIAVPGITYATGSSLTVQFGVIGSGTSTKLTGTVWKTGSTQPTSPQISQSDSTSSLQGSGSAEMQGYLTGSSTTPVTLSVDNYSVKAPA